MSTLEDALVHHVSYMISIAGSICSKLPWHTADSAGTRVSCLLPSNACAPGRTSRGAQWQGPSQL